MTTLRIIMLALFVALLSSCSGATDPPAWNAAECSQLSAVVTAGNVWAASPPAREGAARAEYHDLLVTIEGLDMGPQYERHVAALAATDTESPWHTEDIDMMPLPDAYRIRSVSTDQVYISGEFDRRCS